MRDRPASEGAESPVQRPAAEDERAVTPLVPAFLSGETSCMLVKIGQVMLRLVDARLEPFGLRTRHYSMLRTIIEVGPLSQQELGAMLRIDKATMVSSVDLLEQAGLVDRERVAHDRKRYALTVTPRGLDQAEQAGAALEALDAELLADLAPGQRDGLRDAIEVLNAGSSLASAFDRPRRD